MVHLLIDRYEAIGAHVVRKHCVQIGSPFFDGLAASPKGLGKLGWSEPVDSWVTEPGEPQRLD